MEKKEEGEAFRKEIKEKLTALFKSELPNRSEDFLEELAEKFVEYIDMFVDGVEDGKLKEKSEKIKKWIENHKGR